MENKAFFTKIQLQKIFTHYNLGKVEKITNSQVGFSNDIQFVNDKFVIKKLGTDTSIANLQKEAQLLKILDSKIPKARLLVEDFNCKLVPKSFIILSKVEGISLYESWQTFDNETRKITIKSIAGYLKIINELTIDSELFQKPTQSWYERKTQEFQKILFQIKEKEILTLNSITLIDKVFDKYSYLLKSEDQRLTYWDVHFDNFLVNNNKISAMLDFESVDYYSKDFALMSIKRLTEIPKEYASEEFEDQVIDSEYKEIYNMFKEFYPELFDFEKIDIRIDLYSIIYDLGILLRFPNAEDRKQRLIILVEILYQG